MKHKIGKTAAIFLAACLVIAGCNNTRSGTYNNTPSNDSINNRQINGNQNAKDSQNNHRGVDRKGKF